jgi:hypothetical protein
MRSYHVISREVDALLERGEDNPVTIMALLLELRDCAGKLWADECNTQGALELLNEKYQALINTQPPAAPDGQLPLFDFDPNNKD